MVPLAVALSTQQADFCADLISVMPDDPDPDSFNWIKSQDIDENVQTCETFARQRCAFLHVAVE